MNSPAPLLPPATRWALLSLLVLLLALSRLVPHLANFTPVAALGLLAGAMVGVRLWSLLLPVLAMALSDALLWLLRDIPPVNPTDTYALGKVLDYTGLLLPVLLGSLLQERRPLPRVVGFALLGSLGFFLLSNLGVFLFAGLYPQTPAGLWTCYVLALPFFRWTFAGDVLYSLLFFGAWALWTRRVPATA